MQRKYIVVSRKDLVDPPPLASSLADALDHRLDDLSEDNATQARVVEDLIQTRRGR